MRDKVTRQCPQTTTFEEKGEPKQPRSFCLPAYRLTAGPNWLSHSRHRSSMHLYPVPPEHAMLVYCAEFISLVSTAVPDNFLFDFQLSTTYLRAWSQKHTSDTLFVMIYVKTIQLVCWCSSPVNHIGLYQGHREDNKHESRAIVKTINMRVGLSWRQ